MRFVPTDLDGVLIMELNPIRDERGFFVESFRASLGAEHGFPPFVQDNHSRSAAGVVRGIHYQDARAPLAKLVRCTFGEVLDIAVDLRLGSPTFAKWVGVTLSAENMRCLYIPEGFGHGFVAKSEFAELQYKMSDYYAPETEGAVLWNDFEIGIDWGVENPVLSRRDAAAMTLADYRKNPAFTYAASSPARK